METTNGSSESDGLDETVESRVFRKRRRPFAVKKIASRDLKNPDVSGYMERRGFNGKWTKYWFILIDGCLYCYLTPDDRLTADVVNLHGHSVSTLEDKIRGRKFIVQLLHEEYTTLSLSVESREEMVSWFEELKQGIEKSKEQLRRAVDEKRNSEEKDVNSHMSVTELQDKYNELKCSVKQKLLEEVLRQKDELERKQAVRNKHQSVDVSMDSPRLSSTLPHSHDEQRLSDMTRLTQRRMSAQIKVETIQKQLGSSNHNKKSLFHFGHKKKAEDDQRGHLQEQLQELTSRLNDIDKSLKTCKSDDGCCGSCDQKNIYPLPQRAFSYNGQNGHSESDSVQRDTHRTHHGWKASVQSFAKKTLYKSKKHKTTVEVADGASGGSMSDSDSLDESLSDRVDGGAVIDLTMKQHRSVETSRSLDFSRSGDSCKPKNGSLKNNSSEFHKHRKEVESPKRQIAPSVMAEIDGFEEFAKQMLDKSGASKR